MSIEQAQFVRGNTLKLAGNLEDSVLSVVPKGFNNNILWNLGHIYVVHENLIFKASGNEVVLPEGFVESFAPRTSPKEWGENVPSKETIMASLEEQSNRIAETFNGRLDQTIPKPLTFPGFELSTVRDLLNFASLHEAMHTTTIKDFNKFLQSQD